MNKNNRVYPFWYVVTGRLIVLSAPGGFIGFLIYQKVFAESPMPLVIGFVDFLLVFLAVVAVILSPALISAIVIGIIELTKWLWSGFGRKT